MQNALIIGASGGIGRAVAQHLSAQGVLVTGLSRSLDGLDLTDAASVQSVLGALSGPYDMIFVATGALEIAGYSPEKSLRAVSANGMQAQFALNATGPALVLRHAAALLPRDRRSVFAVLSARVGSIGDNELGGWYSYRAAKAALNQIVHTAAIEHSSSHKHSICVALHPGTVATSFTQKYQSTNSTVPPQTAAQNLVSVLSRLGPEQTGQFFDWAGNTVPW